MRFIAGLLILLLFPSAAHAVRTKDVGMFLGDAEMELIGFSLVAGLQRSGDTQRNEATVRALANRIRNLSGSVEVNDIISRNVAAVMVTATLRVDARAGTRIDIAVASTGDATSLEGGTLLYTVLTGSDGKEYAIAMGPVTLGGFSVSADGNAARKNITTSGRLVNGGQVVREIDVPWDRNKMDEVEFILNNSDYTMADRVATAINAEFEAEIAEARSGSSVAIQVPDEYRGKFARLAARVGQLQVQSDAPARVVINERTGTVVMGSNVTVSAVAVAHGGLTINIKKTNEASQPNPLTLGTSQVVSNTSVNVEEGEGQLALVEGVNIAQLVNALNALGVKPRDLISIMQSIKEAGGLHVEIIAQ
jgi:flagellar P-ring protein precursor FlgI